MAESTAASISLQWILGASTSAGVKSIDSDTLLYLSGNVGVIYGISKKEQKLLRGHVSERGAVCSDEFSSSPGATYSAIPSVHAPCPRTTRSSQRRVRGPSRR